MLNIHQSIVKIELIHKMTLHTKKHDYEYLKYVAGMMEYLTNQNISNIY